MSSISLTQDLISAINALNRLSSVLLEGAEMDDEQTMKITSALDQINNVTSVISDLEDDVDNGIVAEPMPDAVDKTLYGIGETCLLLDPFDNYRVFNLYKDPNDPTSPMLDVSGQKLYLVFKHNNKEIRIPEYETFSPYIKIDKVNGQVLFKINKKQAIDIMSLNSRVFYITRVYESYNSTTDEVVTSDEEVIFSGYWGDRNTTKESNLTQVVEDLRDAVAQKNEIIDGLGNTIADLVNTNQQYLEEKNKALEDLEKLQQEYDELNEMINDNYGTILDAIERGAQGRLIDSRAVMVNYEGADQETKDFFDRLSSSTVD